ncbi:MAG: hypothetical protein HKN20_10110, partial [Gemmatimonadetes bacterium]|nr:hypothetical protein [Gemmatimonadota bacterium]
MRGAFASAGIFASADTLRAVALMVEFPADDVGSTTGDGTFSSVIDANVLIFGAEFPSFDSLGNLVDVDTFDVPHDARYFREQLAYVTQYYREVSYGLQEVSFDLLDSVFVAANPMAYYGLDDSLGTRQPRLLEEVITMADGAIDFSLYDAVYIVHAGVGQETDVFGDSEGDLWTTYYSRFDLADALADSGMADSYRGIPTGDIDAFGDSFYVNEIALIPESETQDGFAQWLLGVACHMTGRVLGAPSLFDPTPPSFPNSQGIGNFGIMGTGLWNSGGILPSPPCAWTKMHLGWLEPLVVRRDTTLSIAMIEVANDSLPILVKVPITESEYYLLSNRWPDQNGDGRFTFTDVDGDNVLGIFEDSYVGAEFDWSIPEEGSTNGAGLFIWHIDEDVIRPFGDFKDINRVNAEAERKGVDLEEADGIQDLDTRARELNNFGSEFDSWTLSNPSFDGPVAFGPRTIPDTRTNFDAATGIEIEVLSESGPVIEVAIRFNRNENAWLREAPGGRTRLVGPVTFGATEDEFLYAVYDSTADSTWVSRIQSTSSDIEGWPRSFAGMATSAPIY